MKTVVLSDTHLSKKFYQKKFDYLQSVIEGADKIIVAGDFWDGFKISFDDFISSRWRALFPLLLEKQAVYIYGNHDRPEWCDERVGLFSVEQGMDAVFDVNGRSYYVAHGHTIFEPFEIWPTVNNRAILKFSSHIGAMRDFMSRRQGPEEGSSINVPMSKWATDNLSDGQLLVCGHSHYPEIDMAKSIVNSGFIGQNYASHVVIDADIPKIISQKY